MDNHRRLDAWQACRELIKEVYRVTEGFPVSERYGLTSQLRRAAVSSASNIAEGFGRETARERARGVAITLGSLAEVDSLLVVSEDLRLLSAPQMSQLDERRKSASRLANALLKKLRAQA